MKENEIEADTFVYHREWGVGRIIELEGNGQWLLVDFRDRPRHRMTREIALRSLSRLPNDGLEATLWNNPETVYGWVRNGPLRLVAAALADAGGRGKPRDLETRLERVLRDVKWSTWWKRIQPFLKESPYFQVKEGTYVLAKRASDVPEELPPAPLKQAASVEQKSSKTRKLASSKEWIKWLFTNVDLAPPANALPQVLLDILEALPAEMLEGVSRRLLSGLRLVLQGKRRPTVRTLETWVLGVTQLSNRWMESLPSASLQALSESLVKFTADLLRQPRYKTFAKDFLQILVMNVKKNDRAAQGVAHGLKMLFQAESGRATELMRGLGEQLPDTVYRLLLRKVASEVFQEGTPEQYRLVLQAVDERDRDYLLEYLSLLAVVGQIPADRVAEALRREWLARQEANRPASLKSLLVAAMLLGDVVKPLHPLMTDGFRSAVREQEYKIADPVVAMLVSIAREEIFQTRQELEQRLRHEVEALNTQLVEAHTETERMHRISDDLQQQLARRREEARLETRRDMLLAIGEILQIMSEKDRKRANLISDIEAGLSLALHAGGAEVLGRVGQEVSYDPRLHQADESLDQGASVVIIAPGVRVAGGQLEDLVLLKARVARRVQGNQ